MKNNLLLIHKLEGPSLITYKILWNSKIVLIIKLSKINLATILNPLKMSETFSKLSNLFNNNVKI
jgi:hypothetical protein